MLASSLLAAVLTVSPLPGIEPEVDPFALNDPFLKISAEALRTRWSLIREEAEESAGSKQSGAAASSLASVASTLGERLDALDALRETTYIDVRLVGFSGDGEHELHLAEEARRGCWTLHLMRGSARGAPAAGCAA